MERLEKECDLCKKRVGTIYEIFERINIYICEECRKLHIIFGYLIVEPPPSKNSVFRINIALEYNTVFFGFYHHQEFYKLYTLTNKNKIIKDKKLNLFKRIDRFFFKLKYKKNYSYSIERHE
jgi:hypothetical protein